MKTPPRFCKEAGREVFTGNELLVKGALQCVKDTDIHENIEPVDLNHLLHCLVEPYLAPAGNGSVWH